jgi:hypothetical protein
MVTFIFFSALSGGLIRGLTGYIKYQFSYKEAFIISAMPAATLLKIYTKSSSKNLLFTKNEICRGSTSTNKVLKKR